MVNEWLTRDNRRPETSVSEAQMRWRWLAGTAAILFWVEPGSAGPAVATRWQQVQGSQEDCLQRAESAIRRTAFGRLERTQQSRYGNTDDDTAGALFENWK